MSTADDSCGLMFQMDFEDEELGEDSNQKRILTLRDLKIQDDKKSTDYSWHDDYNYISSLAVGNKELSERIEAYYRDVQKTEIEIRKQLEMEKIDEQWETDSDSSVVTVYDANSPIFEPRLLRRFHMHPNPSLNVEIRPFRMADMQSCLQCFQAAYSGIYEKLNNEFAKVGKQITFNDINAETPISIVAVLKGTDVVLGFIGGKHLAYGFQSDFVHLRALVVRPAVRRKEVGTMLVSALSRVAFELRAKYIVHGFTGSHSLTMLKFLKNHGFKAIDDDALMDVNGVVLGRRLGWLGEEDRGVSFRIDLVLQSVKENKAYEKTRKRKVDNRTFFEKALEDGYISEKYSYPL
ncbi:unnamed protein product [Caenorhabditis auriculariae]|uniref:N-acetyltransferase domain-containing protein n=1 Tax=Caenorhabditis auriculariae TaxID=2777116 RepID=A0A8S1H842_9PELO|nr:unnamed protein product [Caenorhabditis auriculariae]